MRSLRPSDFQHGVRPLCPQGLFGKMIDRAVLDTSDAKEMVNSTRPIQKAFNSRGIQSIALTSLGALLSGSAVGKGDFSSAFQEMLRLAILDELAKKKEALANYYARTLTVEIPMFTFDVEGQIRVIWCTNGVPQGSVPGSTLFSIGVAPVFRKLQEDFPDFCLAAATDDLIAIIKPASDTEEAWQDLYVRYAKFLTRYEALSLEFCKLRQNLSKGALTLPLNAPLPSPDTMKLFPTGFKVHSAGNVVQPGTPFTQRNDGFVVGGGPVGPPAFIEAFVRHKTDESISKLKSLGLFGKEHKHDAFKLLVTCGIQLMQYTASIVPPSFTMQHLEVFDNTVLATFLEILYSKRVDSALRKSTRMQNGAHRAIISVGSGGLGLLRARISAPAFWWANLRALYADPDAIKHLAGLDCFVPEALACIKLSVGGEKGVRWLDVAHRLVPPSESNDGGLEPLPKDTLRVLLGAAGQHQLSLVNMRFLPENVANAGLNKSDVIHYNSRSDANKIFAAPRFKSWPNDQFVKSVCQYLCLPPPIIAPDTDAESCLGYEAEKCAVFHTSGKRPFLDANGDHQHGQCPSASKMVSVRHTRINDVIKKFAIEAGASARREPLSYDLLQGNLSRAQCAKLFPKHVPAAYKVISATVIDELSKPIVNLDKVAELIGTLPELDPEKSVGLRVDIDITTPFGESRWVDARVVHTSSYSYRNTEFAAVKERLASASSSLRASHTDPLLWEPSPALAASVTEKIIHYEPLMRISRKLFEDNRLTTDAKFVPFVVSSAGEFSREAYQFREFLVSVFRRRVEGNPNIAYPLHPSQAVTDFRQRFTFSILHEVAQGLAKILDKAGQPFLRTKRPMYYAPRY